ncbi:hypothetical protein [Streptomyces sp. NPDC058874]|uniref:hypothetical protein n=1 Tax=unclassified Streptomyces TaxID=2593676 RepID=UPI0036828D55
MQIRPLRDRIAVERIESAELAPPYGRGKVLALGEGVLRDNGTVRPGDIVVFYDGYDVQVEQIDGQEVLLMNQSSIMASFDE